MKIKTSGLIAVLAIPLATGCAAHKARVTDATVTPRANAFEIVAADETFAPGLSSSFDDNMCDPWGNTYTIVLLDSEPGVAISPAKVMIDPWGNPYKIVPR